MSLPTLSTVQELQKALHAKAKQSPDFRFYTLYDKVYRKDVLWSAWRRCLTNGGAAGVDGQTFREIEKYGVAKWLDELAEELRTKAYQPRSVRRVYIPKPDGKQRPLGVPVNETKTHVCSVPAESFDFLGYTFGRGHAPRTGRPYIGARPSSKSLAQLRRAVREQTSARWGLADPEEIVGRLNQKLRGWANYFSYGSVSRAYRAIDYHVRERLRQWLCRKHKVAGRGTARFPLQYGYQNLGLVELRKLKRQPRRANA